MLGSVKIKNLKKRYKTKKIKTTKKNQTQIKQKSSKQREEVISQGYYEISNKCGEKLVLFGQKLFGILREWKIDRENSGLSSRRTLERRDEIT